MEVCDEMDGMLLIEMHLVYISKLPEMVNIVLDQSVKQVPEIIVPVVNFLFEEFIPGIV